MKASHRPTFAEEDVLCKYDSMRLSPDANTITRAPNDSTVRCMDTLVHRSGWTFSAQHDKILNETELVHLAIRMKSSIIQSAPSLQSESEQWKLDDNLEINRCKLHIPPMIFAHDVLILRCGTSSISLNAADAILCWAAQHTIEECEKYPLRIIKVPYAAKWTERMKDGFQLPETSGTSPVSADAAAGGRGDAQPVAPIELAADWTFSSDYVCTLSSAAMDGGSQGGHVQRARSLPSLEVQGAQEARRFQSIQPAVAGEAAGDSGGWRVQAVERSGVDYDLLRRQDEPILFYDEMLLYQDDLEDCGEVSFEAKIRVMPSCWFLLTKQYLRVDGALARCREVRLFHRFSSPDQPADGEQLVHMEVCWRELESAATTVPPIQVPTAAAWNRNTAAVPAPAAARPPPPQMGGVGGMDEALTSARAKNTTHLLPLVNQREGIHQFFTLSTISL